MGKTQLLGKKLQGEVLQSQYCSFHFNVFYIIIKQQLKFSNCNGNIGDNYASKYAQIQKIVSFFLLFTVNMEAICFPVMSLIFLKLRIPVKSKRKLN